MLKWILPGLFVGLLLLAIVRWFWKLSSKYGRLFADEHFIEVGRGVARIKAAALRKLLDPPESGPPDLNDPRVLVTESGLAVLYTIGRTGESFVHHFSVSARGGYTASAVGTMFVLFIAKLLGIPYNSLALGIGRSTVHHAEFELAEADQIEFARRATPEVTARDVDEFRREWLQARDGLQWHPVEAGPE